MLLDKEVLFEFTNPPNERNINTLRDQVIQAKENQGNFLKQEINLVRIEEQLKVKKTQENLRIRLLVKFALTFLMRFGTGNNMR